MFVRTLLGASALGTGYGIWKHQNDEGFNRSVALWTKLGPIVAHYRFVELRQKQFPPANEDDKKAEWDALHQKYADKTVSMLRNMQGMYTKYGQVSAGLTDTFPKLWIEKLRTLEDKVTPQPTNVVAKTILEDTGKSIEELFVEFDDVPLGSASIGQVHRARLRRDGREVAVKVQYPHSLRLFRGDMATIRGFFEIAAPEQVITLSELEKMFAEEFDYRREAINLEDVDANMRRAGFVPSIAVVPLPIQELCTQRVLVMDLLKGQKLVDGVRELVAAVAAKEGKTRDLFEKEMMAKIEAEGLPAQYEGPSAFAISMYKSWLTTYDTTFNSFAFLYNWMIGIGSVPPSVCQFHQPAQYPAHRRQTHANSRSSITQGRSI